MDTEITKKVELLRALLRTKDQFDELIDTGANDEFTDKDKEFMEEFKKIFYSGLEQLEKFIELYYKKLKKGGTLIIWFDLWKISYLKELLEKYKFKQIRFIEWVKKNPMPLNQSINYLTNSREIALLAVKGGKPTFNSKYDKGIYHYPIVSGKRTHPTQKNLLLFEELIKKHSNENDLVVDTFLGSGTTAIACKNTNRKFLGSELDINYYNKIMNALK